jgi:hypothetical protein
MPTICTTLLPATVVLVRARNATPEARKTLPPSVYSRPGMSAVFNRATDLALPLVPDPRGTFTSPIT